MKFFVWHKNYIELYEVKSDLQRDIFVRILCYWKRNVTSNELYRSVMKKRGIEKDSWLIPVNIVRYNLD